MAMIPFIPLNPLALGEEVNEETVVEARIIIPRHAHHIDGLYVKRSSLDSLLEPGLYTSKRINAGKLIGMYTGHMIPDLRYRKFPEAVKSKLGRYTVSMFESDMKVSPIHPSTPEAGVDVMNHPLAHANEPGEKMMANAFMEGRAVETGDALFECLCMYACIDIEPDSEIVWFYGTLYNRVDYKAGLPCNKEKDLEDPLDMLLDCESQPGFEFVAVKLDD